MKHRRTRSRFSVVPCALFFGAAMMSGCSSDNGAGAEASGGAGGGGSARNGAGGGATNAGGGTTGGGGGTGTAGAGGGGTAGDEGSAGAGGASSVAGAAGNGGTAGGAGTGGTSGAGGGAVADAGPVVPPRRDGGGSADAGSGAVTFNPSRAAISGVRGVATPPATQTLQMHNSGTSAVQVTAMAFSGRNPTVFHVTSPAQFPATIPPGGDLPVTLQMDTGATLPAAPANKDSGVTFPMADLTATSSSGSVALPVFGLAAMQANYEATLGQILTALGYPMNVGKAQNDWNWNNPNPPTTLGGVEPGTDEVAAPLFVKAGAGNVTLVPVARFSPEGEMPFGWYPPGMPTMRHQVAAMPRITDPQTSDKARMIYPPLVAPGTTSFDPGATPFGLWAFTGQAAAGTVHGDYNYSQDALNLPAPGVHRVKVFTFKDASGPVPNTYLLGFEEASNGDYQDYVFVLSNVRVAP
jgi:hypothetical protein